MHSKRHRVTLNIYSQSYTYPRTHVPNLNSPYPKPAPAMYLCSQVLIGLAQVPISLAYRQALLRPPPFQCATVHAAARRMQLSRLLGCEIHRQVMAALAGALLQEPEVCAFPAHDLDLCLADLIVVDEEWRHPRLLRHLIREVVKPGREMRAGLQQQAAQVDLQPSARVRNAVQLEAVGPLERQVGVHKKVQNVLVVGLCAAESSSGGRSKGKRNAMEEARVVSLSGNLPSPHPSSSPNTRWAGDSGTRLDCPGQLCMDCGMRSGHKGHSIQSIPFKLTPPPKKLTWATTIRGLPPIPPPPNWLSPAKGTLGGRRGNNKPGAKSQTTGLGCSVGGGRKQVSKRSTHARPGMHMQQCSAVPRDH